MKAVNIVALLMQAVENFADIANMRSQHTAIGRSNMKRKRRELCSVRTRPHSRRNKLGSHKQTMRKLGKLK